MRRKRQNTNSEYATDLINGCEEVGWPGFPKEQRQGRRSSLIHRRSFKAELTSRGVWAVDVNVDVKEGIRRTASMFGRKATATSRK